MYKTQYPHTGWIRMKEEEIPKKYRVIWLPHNERCISHDRINKFLSEEHAEEEYPSGLYISSEDGGVLLIDDAWTFPHETGDILIADELSKIDVSPENYLRTTVYSIEVEDFHTFFLGQIHRGGVWVHDCTKPE